MKVEFYFKSSTGKDLYAKKWYDESINEYKGVVELVHGMEESIARYESFANFLASKGFIVYGHDHLGHGKSVKNDKELGDFDCKDGWLRMSDDIHLMQEIIKEKHPNLPRFILGHSMGSMLVRTYVTLYDDKLNGILILGTSGQKTGIISALLVANIIKLFKGKKHKSPFLSHLMGISLNKNFKPIKTGAEWLTRDEKILEEHRKNLNPNRKFTVESYIQLLKGIKYINKMNNIKKTINIPILLASGTMDPVGENSKGIIRVYNKMKKANLNVEMKLYEGARHEILNEINRDEVYKFILNWIEKNI
ncbi:MAG: alpha/beta fold hydrolase [Clostridia bacterium]|nr:alpha/beta fold hydrolase [Clostridia bacterium]